MKPDFKAIKTTDKDEDMKLAKALVHSFLNELEYEREPKEGQDRALICYILVQQALNFALRRPGERYYRRHSDYQYFLWWAHNEITKACEAFNDDAHVKRLLEEEGLDALYHVAGDHTGEQESVNTASKH